MIKFKCIYCGQRILAKDDGVGKKGKCPKCKHLLTVPESTKGRPAISSDISEQSQQSRETAALSSPAFTEPEKHPDKNLTLDTLYKTLNLGPIDPGGHKIDGQAELYREKVGWFIPSYDELSLFLMAVTFIILGVANTTMQEQILKVLIMGTRNIKIDILALIFLAGMGFSLYHVFTTREKTSLEKWAMLIFAVGVNIITAAAAGYYLLKLKESSDWTIVFPIWNLANAALLFLMLRFRIIDERCIVDRNVTLLQVILGLTAVVAIFLLCNYVFKLHWAITFSICIVYTTSFDRALQSVFPGLTSQKDEQASEV